ncbi:hypothetical protein LIA77_02286 [Sarocladium implicatum]|nr:hypothetical protein LIA77_02286 [Sarocladium implicatum]
MFGFNECESARDAAYNYDGEDHEAHFTHELIAGAAAFAGMKAFENHQRNEGKQVSHGFAKELIAGFAGAEVDKLAETKGLDFLDREKAKHHTKRQAEHLYDEQYGQYNDYDPNQMDPHPTMRY